jgi:hypothetical protein
MRDVRSIIKDPDLVAESHVSNSSTARERNIEHNVDRRADNRISIGQLLKQNRVSDSDNPLDAIWPLTPTFQGVTLGAYEDEEGAQNQKGS